MTARLSGRVDTRATAEDTLGAELRLIDRRAFFDTDMHGFVDFRSHDALPLWSDVKTDYRSYG